MTGHVKMRGLLLIIAGEFTGTTNDFMNEYVAVRGTVHRGEMDLKVANSIKILPNSIDTSTT